MGQDILRFIHCHYWENTLMKSLAKASRLNTVLEVIQHLSDIMTVVETC